MNLLGHGNSIKRKIVKKNAFLPSRHSFGFVAQSANSPGGRTSMSKRQEIRKKRQQARLRETMFWIGGIALFVVLIAVLLLLPGIQGEKLPDADSFVTRLKTPDRKRLITPPVTLMLL
jgi:predicted nucleic acid-binding Zn ribbon protein